MRAYATRNDAVFWEIVTPLGEWASSFDIEAIADQVIDSFDDGGLPRYRCTVSADDFWAIVSDYETVVA
ncbi:hypothetical protein [Bifidobacterium tissieri]|uniref:Uncharacterized protein n=1 Tax=Bifidobacterium tissieri TaxID=1630162 RepID=A0A5M9ZPA1_9BIFI|nr:hypothetical protein [Bifidobacterium tissieri]KAA8829325.1 hypothetical protein EM849_10975 [Bifidobacterium tissieri]KAA8831638.1 hypothetical protein EMO89_02615 [Bifidobacterium tissieri]